MGLVMRSKVTIFIILVLLFSLSAVPVHAQSPPSFPHAFYGNIIINGEDAPVGTVVTALVGGVEHGSYAVKVAGQYGNKSEADYLIVKGNITEGAIINFYVNGIDTTQTASFQPGEDTELNLSVTMATLTVTSNTATSITATSATLNGNLSNIGTASSVTVSFEWGTTIDYGNETTIETLTSTGSFSTVLSGLTPATTYHFRAKVVGERTSYGSDRSFTTATPAVAGDGTDSVADKIDSQGVTTQTFTVESEDGICRLTIDEDTKVLDRDSSPLSQISITEMSELPPLPENTDAIGLTYDLRPDGATFTPPITLELSYNPHGIPDNVNEEELVIAYYDKDTARWIELESVVNTATNTVTASVSHLTTFLILGYKVVVTSAATPADFTLSSLTISPAEAAPSETVTISILITNTGGQSSNYEVTLKINSTVEAISSVTVVAGVTKQVGFTTVKNTSGNYIVDVNGLSGSFTVKEVSQATQATQEPPAAVSQPAAPPPPSAGAPINWLIIGGIIAVVAIALLIFFLVRRRAAY